MSTRTVAAPAVKNAAPEPALLRQKVESKGIGAGLQADVWADREANTPSGRWNVDFSFIPLQAKLAVSQPGDRYEREADSIADTVARGGVAKNSLPGATQTAPAQSPQSLGLLSSQGQPLDAATRGLMENRMAQDFSGVRVHADAEAAASARSLEARAYTVGHHVAFGTGEYQPSTPAGRHLLAHELTHVVQQRAGLASGTFQRRGIFETIGIFLGLTEGKFSDKELQDYLKKVTGSEKIEDSFDSDNKARAIVRKWKAGDAQFNLTGAQKALLIEEMESGYVSGDDERGILDLIEKSDNTDLKVIFTTRPKVTAQRLLKDFGGKSLKELKGVLGTRFKGGIDALKKGAVEPQGAEASGAPKFPYSWTIFKAKLAGASDDVLLAYLGAFNEDERDRAVRDLSRERTRVNRQLVDLADQLEKEKDKAKQDAIKAQGKKISDYRTRIEVLLENLSKDLAIAETPAGLSATTKIPTAAQKTQIQEALKPDLKRDAAGVVIPFVDTLPGETKNYEQKLREYLPGMIDNYFNKLVVDKGKKEHDDKSKIHELKEFEDLGQVSQQETDKVFGSYKKGPPLKADTKSKRGTIHDLFADMQKDLASMTKAQRRDLARVLMFYFFRTNRDILALNHDHNADPDVPGSSEAKSLDTLAKEFTTTDAQVKKLNEIDRGWPASEDTRTREVNIQLFKGKTPDEDRDFLWDMFQTLIHEYLHSLVHSKYETFAKSFPRGEDSSQFNTLIEGVDSYLDEVVWANVQPRVDDPDLRKKVEGPVNAAKPPMVVKPASRRRYASYTQAIKLIDIVGPRNLYAAYFLGEVEKIGG